MKTVKVDTTLPEEYPTLESVINKLNELGIRHDKILEEPRYKEFGFLAKKEQDWMERVATYDHIKSLTLHDFADLEIIGNVSQRQIDMAVYTFNQTIRYMGKYKEIKGVLEYNKPTLIKNEFGSRATLYFSIKAMPDTGFLFLTDKSYGFQIGKNGKVYKNIFSNT